MSTSTSCRCKVSWMKRIDFYDNSKKKKEEKRNKGSQSKTTPEKPQERVPPTPTRKKERCFRELSEGGRRNVAPAALPGLCRRSSVAAPRAKRRNRARGNRGRREREEGARTSTRVDPVARNSEAYNPGASKRACVSSDPFIPPRSESD